MSKRWSDLDPATRKHLAVAGAVDATLRAAALLDLARRDASEVRGSKKAWGWGLALVSSSGLLPVVYFLRGRRSH